MNRSSFPIRSSSAMCSEALIVRTRAGSISSAKRSDRLAARFVLRARRWFF